MLYKEKKDALSGFLICEGTLIQAHGNVKDQKHA